MPWPSPAAPRRSRSPCGPSGCGGRDVIVPANTFYATAAAVLQAGARPVFADVDAATFALSPPTVAAALTPDTAAVRARAHRRADHARRRRAAGACDERGIALVEDAAHAHGATFDGRFAGSFGAAGGLLVLPHQGRHQRRGRHDAHLVGGPRREARIYRDQGKGAFTANHHVRLGSPGG